MSFVLEQAERMRRRREELIAQAKSASPIAPTRQTKIDYQAALHRWWSSMAPSVRQHPWSMDTIMSSAFPGQNPAPRCVAATLRDIMGFTEKRDWTRAGRNRRQWIPPAK